MHEYDLLQRRNDFSMIVISQTAAALPNELALDRSAQLFRHRGNEYQVSRAMHGCVKRIACTSAIPSLKPL